MSNTATKNKQTKKNHNKNKRMQDKNSGCSEVLPLVPTHATHLNLFRKNSVPVEIHQLLPRPTQVKAVQLYKLKASTRKFKHYLHLTLFTDLSTKHR